MTTSETDLAEFPVLQPGSGELSGRYLSSTPDNLFWGRLPSQDDEARAAVEPGEVITVDTLSHEGIMEDQGRDPGACFGQFGVAAHQVLDDARALAASTVPHDFDD